MALRVVDDEDDRATVLPVAQGLHEAGSHHVRVTLHWLQADGGTQSLLKSGLEASHEAQEPEFQCRFRFLVGCGEDAAPGHEGPEPFEERGLADARSSFVADDPRRARADLLAAASGA